MLLFPTVPTSPITAPANSGKGSNFEFPAHGRAFSLLLRTISDQNKRNRSLEREQKRRENCTISDLSNFDGLVCGNQESFRGQVRLKSFVIIYRFNRLELKFNLFYIFYIRKKAQKPTLSRYTKAKAPWGPAITTHMPMDFL